jgi:fucokinase
VSLWDYLIVTASNDRQAEAYRSQLDLRKKLGRIPQAKRVLAVADPGGIRVGSGGSTIACIMRVLEIELAGDAARAADPRAWRETLDRLRILIIHAGGDSKRLPAYGPCGKIFVPVPAARRGEATHGRLPVTIFDRLAPIYLGLPAPADGRGHVVISTGDVLLFFDPARAAFTRDGITALGCLASPEVAKNHGIFIPNAEGTIRRYLQKPTVAAQIESGAMLAGAKGRSILDLGVMSIDAAAAVRLLKMCGVGPAGDSANARGGSGAGAGSSARPRLSWSGPMGRAIEKWGLDIFREVACALGADTEFADYVEAARAAGSAWDEVRLRGVYAALHSPAAFDHGRVRPKRPKQIGPSPQPSAATWLSQTTGPPPQVNFSLSLIPRCLFLHFGTSRELIRSGNALRRRDRTAAPGDTVVSLNNTFTGKGRIEGAESWVEGCRIGAKLTVPGRNVIVGLDVDAPLAFPPNAALDILKGTDRRVRDDRVGRAVCDNQVGCVNQVAKGDRVVRDDRVVWFVRPYAIDDVFHKPAEQGGRLAGLALGEWLEAMGARVDDVWDAAVPPRDRQIWNGRFFPAAASASSCRGWLWMLDPRKATSAQRRAWREADRYSFAEMAARADQEAFHARRRSL